MVNLVFADDDGEQGTADVPSEPTNEGIAITCSLPIAATSDLHRPVNVDQPAKTGDDEDEDVDAMFADLKKKKKKKKKEISAESLEELGESMDDLTLAKSKKKSKPSLTAEDIESIKALTASDIAAAMSAVNPEEEWQKTDRDYTYAELLARVYRTIRQQNPDMIGGKKKYSMVTPIVAREGSKKTAFSNIADICRRMNRQPEHLIAYIFAELGTQGSVDGSHRLLIKGRFQQKQIESVLRHYIGEYVTCQTCKSPDTTMKKENKLFFLQCQACGSSRAVSAIKSGFRAQTGKRSATRQQ